MAKPSEPPRPVDTAGSSTPDRAPYATIDSKRRLRITWIVCLAVLGAGLLLLLLFGL